MYYLHLFMYRYIRERESERTGETLKNNKIKQTFWKVVEQTMAKQTSLRTCTCLDGAISLKPVSAALRKPPYTGAAHTPGPCNTY